jgi:hypothetical protein
VSLNGEASGSAGRSARRLALSLFALWHTAAMIAAPYPAGALKDRFAPVFGPYLRLGFLEHSWAFFGPRPAAGSLVSYTLRSAAGEVGPLPLTEGLNRGGPAFFRYSRLFDALNRHPPEVEISMARHLCRQHAAIRPRQVAFLIRHQLPIPPEEVARGVAPTDERYLWEEWREPLGCEE